MEMKPQDVGKGSLGRSDAGWAEERMAGRQRSPRGARGLQLRLGSSCSQNHPLPCLLRSSAGRHVAKAGASLTH